MDNRLGPGAICGAVLILLLVIVTIDLGGWVYGKETAGQGVRTQTTRQTPRQSEAPFDKAKKNEGTAVKYGQINQSTDRRTAGRFNTYGSQSEQLQKRLGMGKEAKQSLESREQALTATKKYSTLDFKRGDNTNIRTDRYDYLGNFTLTAYTAGYESTQKHKGDPGYGVPYCGGHVKKGITVAADLDLLPCGTVVYIEGLGRRVVEDKGSLVNGKHIDVYFTYLDTAQRFGVKDADVYVISWGPVKNE